MSNLYGPVFYSYPSITLYHELSWADTQAEFWVLPDWAHSAQAGAGQWASLGISKRRPLSSQLGQITLTVTSGAQVAGSLFCGTLPLKFKTPLFSSASLLNVSGHNLLKEIKSHKQIPLLRYSLSQTNS